MLWLILLIMELEVTHYLQLHQLEEHGFQKEQFKQALNQFNPIAKDLNAASSAFDQDVNMRIADCHYMLKEYSAASSTYDKLIDLNSPQSDYALFQKSMIAGVKSSKDKIKLETVWIKL